MRRSDLVPAELPVLLIPCAAIRTPSDRLRSLKAGHARAIGAAIAADGQYDPITVAQLPGDDGFELVDGLHRLEGCRDQGILLIEARIGSAERETRVRQEIMSAWARAGHDAFDKAAQVAAMADLHRNRSEADDDELCNTMLQGLRWDEATAESLDISRMTVFRCLKVARGFTAEQITLLRERGMADELMPLVRVADLPPEDLASLMGWIAEGVVASIAEAMALLVPEKPPSHVAEKAARSLIKKMADWDVVDRKRLIAKLLEAFDRNGNPRSEAAE